MPLKTHRDFFILDPFDNTWTGDIRYLLKVAENNTLRLHPDDSSKLKFHLDSKGNVAIGYGYDIYQNRATVISDLTSTANMELTEKEKTTIRNITKEQGYISSILSGLALPDEQAASNLLDLAINARLGSLDLLRRIAVGDNIYFYKY